MKPLRILTDEAHITANPLEGKIKLFRNMTKTEMKKYSIIMRFLKNENIRLAYITNIKNYYTKRFNFSPSLVEAKVKTVINTSRNPIQTGFIWIESPQGDDFWMRKYNRLGVLSSYF